MQNQTRPSSVQVKAPKINRKLVKDWTDIMVPWVQVTGLIAAGIFALMEYEQRKADVRVERATTYLSRFGSESMVSARMKLSRTAQEKLKRLQEVVGDRRLSQDQVNTAYYQFVVDELIMRGSAQSLEPDFLLILGFLDDGVMCAQQKLCEEMTVKTNLWDYGHSFVRTYTPYLCYLRRAWNDSSIGQRVEFFYNPSAASTACNAYYDSIKKTLPASG